MVLRLQGKVTQVVLESEKKKGKKLAYTPECYTATSCYLATRNTHYICMHNRKVCAHSMHVQHSGSYWWKERGPRKQEAGLEISKGNPL